MAITSPGIVKASNEALVAVQPAINMIKEFAFDCSDEFAAPGTTVKIPVVSSGALSAFSDTDNDFEDADGTMNWETIELTSTVKSTFEIPRTAKLDMPMDGYWSTIAKAAAQGVTKYVSDTIGSLFDVTLTAQAQLADYTNASIAGLRAACLGRPDDTVLVVAPEVYSAILANNTAQVYGNVDAVQNGLVKNLFGFKSVVEGHNLPEGTLGALVPSSCLVVASRPFAVADESMYLEYGAESDENGFTLTTLRHGTPRNGKMFINVAALFGAKLIQKDKIVKIVAAG